MRAAEYYAGKPIESLQVMLRTISDVDPRILPVIPDGRYGSNTYASVRSFQESVGIPPSGIADLETWNRVVDAYDHALLQTTTPLIRPMWNSQQIVLPGEHNRHIYLVQAMLIVLSHDFSDITAPTLSGILDEPTNTALRQIQAASGIAETGNLDTATWNSLSALYSTLIRNEI